jgi:ectoine hydroxylase-related dioxygenase (phytanoyl-CoA dioxygenase family)
MAGSTSERSAARAAGETDPFGAEAQTVARERLITTEAERAEMAGPAADLAEHGHVALPDMLDAEALAQARAALDPINDANRWGVYAFEGERTKRVYSLLSLTRDFDFMAADRRMLALIESHFGESPVISAAQGMTLYGGQEAQPLHRDDGHYLAPRPRPPFVVSCIWALDEFTVENGATRFVSGSHGRPGDSPPDGPVSQALVPAGSVFVYDGALWHGGGAASGESRRRAINMIYCRPWLRQQENWVVTTPPDEAKALPKIMQRLFGYWIHGFTLNTAHGMAPLKAHDMMQRG